MTTSLAETSRAGSRNMRSQSFGDARSGSFVLYLHGQCARFNLIGEYKAEDAASSVAQSHDVPIVQLGYRLTVFKEAMSFA